MSKLKTPASPAGRQNSKVLVVCGPTATGKTALAIALAKRFGGELVNADSRQVYKGLDALTGKDRSKDVPILLYDVVDVDRKFSVAHFVRLAQAAIDSLHKRGKLPIVVGGTGFYLQALTASVDTLTIPPNWELRKKLNSGSVEMLQQELQRVDVGRWRALNGSDRKNPRRLVRAIEVALSANLSPPAKVSYDALWIGLGAPMPVLKKRIAQRISERFDKALAQVREGLPPILGVEPLLLFQKGAITKEAALAKWVQAEYQYARRQLTWFRKVGDIRWFDITQTQWGNKVEVLVGAWYTRK